MAAAPSGVLVLPDADRLDHAGMEKGAAANSRSTLVIPAPAREQGLAASVYQ